MTRTGASREPLTIRSGRPSQERHLVTLLWFIVWFIANIVGDHEPLLFNAVNASAGILLLIVALDLSTQHAPGVRRAPARQSVE